MSSSKTCLVIGANGFIGSHLVDELAAAGFKVRAFDLYSQPQQFNHSPQVEILKGDYFDDQTLGKALDNMAYVFHCFSATTPFSSDADPYTDIKLNLLRSVQLFEKAAEAKIKKIIFISSGGAIYGPIAEQKMATEEDAPTPVSPYGIVKLATENYLAYFKRKYNVDYIVYRLTNPYGQRQVTKNNQGVIPAFIDKLSRGQKIVVIGDGSSSRDYIYIGDAARMIIQSFAKNSRHSVYNIGSGHQTTINDIIKTLEQITHLSAIRESVDVPKTFLHRSQVSVSRFKEEFGNGPTTSFKDGLLKTINQKDLSK